MWLKSLCGGGVYYTCTFFVLGLTSVAIVARDVFRTIVVFFGGVFC